MHRPSEILDTTTPPNAVLVVIVDGILTSWCLVYHRWDFHLLFFASFPGALRLGVISGSINRLDDPHRMRPVLPGLSGLAPDRMGGVGPGHKRSFTHRKGGTSG